MEKLTASHGEPISTRQSAMESVLPSRMLPRVSFQTMLILMSVSAVIIAIIYAADQGGVYATAASVGLGFLLVTFLTLAAMFLLSWSISFIPKLIGVILVAVGFLMIPVFFMQISVGVWSFLSRPIALINFQVIGWCLILLPIGVESETEEESPFAVDQMPPQIMAPREPAN